MAQMMETALPSVVSNVLPSVLSGVGTGMVTAGQLQQGNAAQLSAERRAAATELSAGRKAESLEFEADQLEYNSGQVLASSQREAMEERRAARLVASRALAVAAASGGGASDPTIINLMSQIAGEGKYRAMTSLYQGEAQARQMRLQGKVRRIDARNTLDDAEAAAAAMRADGAAARRGAQLSAGATALSKTASMFGKYFAGQDEETPAVIDGGGGAGGGGSDSGGMAWGSE